VAFGPARATFPSKRLSGAATQLSAGRLPTGYAATQRADDGPCEAEWNRADQIGETRWITRINEIHGFPHAIVAHAWFHIPDAAEILARQAAFPLVRGIRSKPVAARSPADMRPGAPGSMQDDTWLCGFADPEQYGFAWDLRVPFWHLPEAAEVARAVPRTPIVVNHTGSPWERSEEGIAAWRRAMDVIAQQPNVHLKVSKFGLKDQPWDFESDRRVVLDAIATFGIERCMFASNFPVSGLRIAYGTLVSSVSRMLEGLSPQDRERFFVGNAVAFYHLPARPQPSDREA
jgi:predicted TIM-barrel fold metal-dependent hydrolase